MDKPPTYQDCAAYVGDLYMKWQDSLRSSENRTNQIIEDLRSQLAEKSRLVRKLEEDISSLQLENARLNAMGTQGKTD